MINNKYIYFKYKVDLLVSIITLLVGFPFFIILAFLLLITQGRPILFTHNRIGKDGRYFKFYKFRTMKQTKVTKTNPYICNEGDERITFIGRIYRKFSLDEFPQLLNIFKGEMSFVGPRPAVFDEFKYEKLTSSDNENIILRNTVRPGLTGLAQIKGRNSNLWTEKLFYDSKYIDNLNNSFINCLIKDLLIILFTFKEIFITSGEYDK